jgi:1-pyrroline-5-carboxylate dehydrogenase
MLEEFRNESFTDFTRPDAHAAFEAALSRAERAAGEEVPLVVGGRRVTTGRMLENTNPADRSQVVSRHHLAGRDLAEAAVGVAVEAQRAWQEVPPRERATVLLRAARRMRERRHDFSATMVLEIGKTWPEADVETAEAIDFLEFYAREMLRWGGEQPVTPYRGEFPEVRYLSLGAGVVIPPWNFPNAILTGMAAAAIVTGNSVLLKPASDTPLIGWRVFTLLEEAGVPPGVLNYLPGPGADVGDFLVGHPKVRFISFTGSKPVGLGIQKKAAEIAPGQVWIKRTVLEMGGKDFIVVDADADFDDAVQQVVGSAFGFQGQKCSACSRAIVHRDLYSRFVEAVKAKTEALPMGPPRDFKNFIGPVSSERQFKTVTEYIEVGKKEGRLVAGGPSDGTTGNFIRPTVFDGIRAEHRVFCEEIFGPVLSMIEAKDTEHAFELANATEFGLTGSYFGRDRTRIAAAKRRLFCGNLYVNRKCTGALVGVHPFGGFNMSGTDSKAGGRDYLGLFLQAKSISEKL